MAGILLIALLIPLLAVVLDSPPARALASRLERDGPARDPGGGRVVALEAEVQRLSEQVAELAEETRFLRQLLADRPARPGLGAGEGSPGG